MVFKRISARKGSVAANTIKNSTINILNVNQKTNTEKAARLSSMALCDIYTSTVVGLYDADAEDATPTDFMFAYRVMNSGSSPAVEVVTGFGVVSTSKIEGVNHDRQALKRFYEGAFKDIGPIPQGTINPAPHPDDGFSVPMLATEGITNSFKHITVSNRKDELKFDDTCICIQISYKSLAFADYLINVGKTFILHQGKITRTFDLEEIPGLNWIDDGGK